MNNLKMDTRSFKAFAFFTFLFFTTTVVARRGDRDTLSQTCGQIISTECQSEYDNALGHGNLNDFCSRCSCESGKRNPFRQRCSICCSACDGDEAIPTTTDDLSSALSTTDQEEKLMLLIGIAAVGIAMTAVAVLVTYRRIMFRKSKLSDLPIITVVADDSVDLQNVDNDMQGGDVELESVDVINSISI